MYCDKLKNHNKKIIGVLESYNEMNTMLNSLSQQLNIFPIIDTDDWNFYLNIKLHMQDNYNTVCENLQKLLNSDNINLMHSNMKQMTQQVTEPMQSLHEQLKQAQIQHDQIQLQQSKLQQSELQQSELQRSQLQYHMKEL